MIALLRGIVAESNFSGCILDVHGVGYEVAIPLSTFDKLPQPGGEATLHIQTQVREDAITLFGFATPEEKELFRKLINVSGIGGKAVSTAFYFLPDWNGTEDSAVHGLFHVTSGSLKYGLAKQGKQLCFSIQSNGKTQEIVVFDLNFSATRAVFCRAAALSS